MTGVYAIAEAVDDSNKRPEKTLFCFLDCDLNIHNENKSFDEGQTRSLKAVRKMILRNGAAIFVGLNQLGEFLNKRQPNAT